MIEAVADVPEARRDPEIRQAIAAIVEAGRSDWARYQLVKDSGTGTRERYSRLAAFAPDLAARLLADPEFADITRLVRADVEALLTHDVDIVRERAIASLSLCQGRRPTSDEVRRARNAELDWRSRLPEEIPF